MDPATLPIDPDYLLSGFIAFILLSFVLYGVLTAQTYMYTARFPSDSTTTKLAVFGLWFLESVHTLLTGRVTFYYGVYAIKNPDHLLKIDWSVALVLWLEIGIVAIVQGSYIRRIWILSEKWKLLTGIAIALFLARIVFLGASAYHMFRFPTWAAFQGSRISNLFVETAIGLSVAVDFVVASTMVYYCRIKHMGSSRTNRSSKLDYALNSLMTYSVHSGLITTGVSLSVALTYACLKDNLVYVGLAALVSKLYSNSLLGMLNARIHLRSMVFSGPAMNVNLEALSESSGSAAV